jgi:hypothetical protein
LPSAQEWQDEFNGWGPNKSQSAFDFLKIPLAGRRFPTIGVVDTGSVGFYHSSTAGTGVLSATITNTTATTPNVNFGTGRSIRCIKI